MKFLHLSDLHLGKRVNEFSMLEEQKEILHQILQITVEEMPDAVLICGDVYDKPIPPAEAVNLLDDFLCRLAELRVPVILMSGNHDSAERVAFGGRLMERSGVYVAPLYDGTVRPILFSDAWGEVRVYALPFLRPAHVRRFYPDAPMESYTDAMRIAIEHMNIDSSVRNILLAHQFVTGASRCDSEEVSVGGLDNVDASVFEDFDYVALGHIHGPQWVARESIRYCGSPLKYSFSEAKQQKSVTVVELARKGSLTIRTVPLTPLHDLRQMRGSYWELTDKRNYAGQATEDYLHLTLTDEEEIPNAFGKLRTIYPNLMALDYDNARTRGRAILEQNADVEHLSPTELFAQFYEERNAQPMTQEQAEFVRNLMLDIWEDAPCDR